MKKIQLTLCKTALIDDEDFDRVSQLKWYAWTNDSKRFYARHNTYSRDGRETIWLHRFILNTPPGKIIDHINGDGLDNRRENLRICTNRQNIQNQIRRSSKYGFKGIHASGKKFFARIKFGGKRIYLYSRIGEKIFCKNKVWGEKNLSWHIPDSKRSGNGIQSVCKEIFWRIRTAKHYN